MLLITAGGLLWTSLSALWLCLDATRGTVITEADAPALFEALARILKKTKGPVIDHMLLDSSFTAITRLSWMSLASWLPRPFCAGAPGRIRGRPHCRQIAGARCRGCSADRNRHQRQLAPYGVLAPALECSSQEPPASRRCYILCRNLERTLDLPGPVLVLWAGPSPTLQDIQKYAFDAVYTRALR